MEKKFIPYGRNKSRTKYCPLAHYVECGICGKETFIKRSRLKEVKKNGYFSTGCSKECTNKLKHESAITTIKERYGVTNASNVPGSREKAAFTMKSEGTYDIIAKKEQYTLERKIKKIR